MIQFALACFFVALCVLRPVFASEQTSGAIPRPPEFQDSLSDAQLLRLRFLAQSVPFETRARFEAAYVIWKDAYGRGMLSAHRNAVENNTREPLQAFGPLWPETAPLLLVKALGYDGYTNAIQLFSTLTTGQHIAKGPIDPTVAVRFAREYLDSLGPEPAAEASFYNPPGLFGPPFNQCVLSTEDLDALYARIALIPDEKRAAVENIFKEWEDPTLGQTPLERSEVPMARLAALGPDVAPLVLERACQKHIPYFLPPYAFVVLVQYNDPGLTRAVLAASLANSNLNAVSAVVVKYWLRDLG